MTEKIKKGLEIFYSQFDKESPNFDYVEKRFDGYLDVLIKDGKEIPLLWWRSIRTISALIDMASSDKLKKCCLNVYSFAQKNISLKELLVREIDIAECALGSKCSKITAFKNGDSCNVIAVMKNESVANLELATTMPESARSQCQHRLITDNGMVCDRAVDNVVFEERVSVYSQNKGYAQTYDDGETLLYGYTEEEVSKCYCVFMLLRKDYDENEFIKQFEHLNCVYNAFENSVALGNTVLVKGE